MKDKRSPPVRWGIRRREAGWVAVVFLGEAPLTLCPPTSKTEARAIARKRAAEFRKSAS